MAANQSTFKQEIIHKTLQFYFKDKKMRVSSEAQLLTTEYLRLFVAEAACRAAKEAKDSSSSVVTIEHFEKILPQLLLDF